MGRNLSNLYISQSYQFITQVSGSELQDGLGNTITSLNISASYATTSSHAHIANHANTATSASYALTASYALNGGGGGTVNTGSLLVTASAAQNVVTFTKGDGSTFPVTIATGSAASAFPYTGSAGISGSLIVTGSISVTGSVGGNLIGNNTDTYTTSAPVRQIVTLTQTEYNALGSPDPNTLYVISGSAVFDSSIYATTGSNTFNGNQNVIGSVSASLGFSGSLSGNATTATTAATASYVVTALTASSTPNAVVNATVSNATITYTKGDGTTFGTTVNNVANATSASYAATASIATSSSYALNATNATTAGTASFIPSNVNLNVASISASSAVFQSASIGFLTSVSGSVVNIGTSYITLNTSNATRYAGIKVEDSGSASPINYTASFNFDSQTNDWFYEYSGSDNTNFGVAMFGPEYATKGSPTYLTNNRLSKGNGGHHLNDSTITDDGTTVTFTTPIVGTQITASVGFSGNLTGTASFATTAATASTGGGLIAGSATAMRSAPYLTTTPATASGANSIALGSGAYTLGGGTVAIGTSTQAQALRSVALGNTVLASGLNAVAIGYNVTASASNGVNINGAFIYDGTIRLPFATQVTGSLFVSGGITGSLLGTASFANSATSASYSLTSTSASYAQSATSASYALTASYALNVTTPTLQSVTTAGDTTNVNTTFNSTVDVDVLKINNNGFAYIDGGTALVAGRTDGADNDFILAGRNWSSAAINVDAITMTDGLFIYNQTAHEFTGSVAFDNAVTVNDSVVISGSINVSGSVGSSNLISNNTDTFTGSPKVYEIVTCTQAEYNTVSGSANANNTLYVITDNTGSGAYIEGAVQGNVSALTITSNTASLDCDAANFFTLTLVSGSNTYINPTNINSGQTINLRITQANPGNGTVSFPSSVKQVSGSAYTPSAGSGPVDIVTFIAFDNSSLYLSNVKNLV